MAKYDCSKCPGYCCSYPLIQLTKRDVQRLAKHFGLDFETARKKFTKVDPEAKYAMRRKADEHFGRICQFFDTEERRCTIYTARPTICREYPGGTLRLLRFPAGRAHIPERPGSRRVHLERLTPRC